jgi:hypothetical protein
VTFSGLALGIISILITLIVGGMLWMGVDALAQ